MSNEIFEELKALELELVDPSTRKNRDRIQELLAEDVEEFGSSGKLIHKADVLSALQSEENTSYELNEFAFKELSRECILVKYQARIGGQKSLRSSVWINDCGRWQMLHHQSTVFTS